MKAQGVIEKSRELMQLLGIEGTRLRREWISASEGSRFAEVVRTFTDEIKEIGHNPIAKRETPA